MRRVYDVFERFPDGSSLWRTSVAGRFEAHRRMQELGEHSENEFFLIDVPIEDYSPAVPSHKSSRRSTMIVAVG